jgi:hypothetical protein
MSGLPAAASANRTRWAWPIESWSLRRSSRSVIPAAAARSRSGYHFSTIVPLRRRSVFQDLCVCGIVRGSPKQAMRLLSPNRVIEEIWSSEIVNTSIPLAR